MNRLLEAGGSCGATWGSPVPASLSPSMSLGHPVSCRRCRRHLPGTMLSSLEADPTSMVFWWTRSGVRHHVRLTGVRDASSHGSTARMSAAGSALLIPNHPGTQAYLGHPAAHRHSQSPWLQPGPRAAPQVPGSRAVPPGHCQLSADSELGLPHRIPQQPPTPRATSTRFAPASPIPRDAQAQSPHLLHPAGLGKAGEHETPQIN